MILQRRTSIEQKGHGEGVTLFYKCSHLKEKCYTWNRKCLFAFSSSKRREKSFLGQQGGLKMVHSFKQVLCMLNEAIQFNDGLNGFSVLNGLLKGKSGFCATDFLRAYATSNREKRKAFHVY